MKAAIYVRVSTEEQNPENQLKDCLSICKVDNPLIFAEKQSAFKDKEREQFGNILKLIKRKECSDLIVWDLDRIYRNRRKLVGFFGLCKAYKCKIHSFRQQWLEELNSVPEPWNEVLHEFLLQIMGWMAEEESEKKSKRVKAAVRKLHKGTFSYKGNKWGRKELSTFKTNKIKGLREQGKSIRDIAGQLNISVGAVHKTLSKLGIGKMNITPIQKLGNL